MKFAPLIAALPLLWATGAAAERYHVPGVALDVGMAIIVGESAIKDLGAGNRAAAVYIVHRSRKVEAQQVAFDCAADRMKSVATRVYDERLQYLGDVASGDWISPTRGSVLETLFQFVCRWPESGVGDEPFDESDFGVLARDIMDQLNRPEK